MRQTVEWVLWGKHPSMAGGVPLKLVGGSLAKCRRERRMRERFPRWHGFAIVKTGEPYPVPNA